MLNIQFQCRLLNSLRLLVLEGLHAISLATQLSGKKIATRSCVPQRPKTRSHRAGEARGGNQTKLPGAVSCRDRDRRSRSRSPSRSGHTHVAAHTAVPSSPSNKTQPFVYPFPPRLSFPSSPFCKVHGLYFRLSRRFKFGRDDPFRRRDSKPAPDAACCSCCRQNVLYPAQSFLPS